MFEIESDSEWSQYKLIGSDIIDIFYLSVPPVVVLYVNNTTIAISNDRAHSGTKQVSLFQVTHLIQIGSMNWSELLVCSLFYLTSSGTLALQRFSLCRLSAMNLNLHHTEGNSSDTYFSLHSTNIQAQTAYE